jgi:predicted O-linked N-acetylglucosamine transferase (SPINDLY family)
VTLPSQFLRGRLTYGMYRQMGISDLVAADATDYVRLAVRLGIEPDYREQLRRRITEASSVLFEDVTVVREVEQFLLSAVRQ